VVCRGRIDSADEGRYCDECDYPVHKDCAREPPPGADGDVCPGCGADFRKPARRKVARRARRDADDRDHRPGRGPPYPVGKVCPECGHDKYEKRRPKGWVAFTDDRICTRCGTRYTPPTPVWAALVFLFGGLLVAGVGAVFLLVSLLGRGGVINVGLAVVLVGMGGVAMFHGVRCLAGPGRA